METYIAIPVPNVNIKINNIYDINNKLNKLNNYFCDKLYDNFSFNFDNDMEESIEELKILLSDNKTKNKNYIKKATFYIKISGKTPYSENQKLQKQIMKCPICYDLILDNNKYLKLTCNHLFCNECYNTWNEKCSSNNICTSCPMCREIVS